MKDKTGWNKYRHKKRTIEPREEELTIESLTNSGDGLGRIDERVVFVPYTLPGDKVRIKIVQRKKTYALAEAIDLLEPSEHRITAQCSSFERCGGCDWQHVPYSMQLEAKEQQLRETLERIGFLSDLPIEPIVQSDKPFNYRNRIQGEIRGGQFHFKQRRSDQRIAVSRCEIAEEAINEWLQSDDLEHTPAGRVEIALIDEKIVVVPVNEKNSSELGFRQINSFVSDHLTALVLDSVSQSNCPTVVDLYCGRGTWANEIAQHNPDKQITGVDSSEDNIQAAKEHAGSLSLKNVNFLQTSVEKVIGKVSINNSLCIVDPPRAGLDTTVLNGLTENHCQQLIYVSCHPATLARDLKLLTQADYKIQSIQPLDMFPQTAHLECLVQLSGPT